MATSCNECDGYPGHNACDCGPITTPETLELHDFTIGWCLWVGLNDEDDCCSVDMLVGWHAAALVNENSGARPTKKEVGEDGGNAVLDFLKTKTMLAGHTWLDEAIKRATAPSSTTEST
jgi:hypothetical protein